MYAVIEDTTQNVIGEYPSLADALRVLRAERSAGGSVDTWSLYVFDAADTQLLGTGPELVEAVWGRERENVVSVGAHRATVLNLWAKASLNAMTTYTVEDEPTLVIHKVDGTVVEAGTMTGARRVTTEAREAATPDMRLVPTSA